MPGFDGLLNLVGHVAFVRVLFVQERPFTGIEFVGLAKCDSIVSRRLSMRSDVRSMRGRESSEAQNVLSVSCAIRMVGQPRRRRVRPGGEQGKHLGVQGLLPRLRQGVFKCPTRQLVPEGERAVLTTQHPDTQTTLDTGLIERNCGFQQPTVRLARDNAYQLRDLTRARRQPRSPRKDRIAHHDRHACCRFPRELR